MAMMPLPQNTKKMANTAGFLDKSSPVSTNVLVTTFNDVMRIDCEKTVIKRIQIDF
jgi:hypothetical protein